MFARPALIALLACWLLLPAYACAQSQDLASIEALVKDRQYDQALQRIDNFLATRPKDPRGRFLKGVILTAQSKVLEATRVFIDLTNDYPELPEPYNNVAVLYAGQGDYEKARLALEMAVRANPSYAIAHENLGDVYARMAGQSYDRAAKIDKANKSAPLKLKAVNDMLSAVAP